MVDAGIQDPRASESGMTSAIPPGPRRAGRLHGFAFAVDSRRVAQRMRERHGPAFTLHVPVWGPTVFLSDPTTVKQLFTGGTDLVGVMESNLSRVVGPSSFFSLDGDEHKRQRKLLLPPFHGRRMQSYEGIIEEETRRETAQWPEGEPFPTLASMKRITLNAILRAVFGAQGEELAMLRDLLPPMVGLGLRLSILPGPEIDLGRFSPWGRFLGYRRRFDAIVDRLIAATQADPDLDERDDILALMLQARFDDGSAMPPRAVADQLLTLLAAGHETTATTLAWAIERLRRHPRILARVVAEADEGGSLLRKAAIMEVQRTRPVVAFVGRTVTGESLVLGRWVLPRGYNVMVAISLLHADDSVFPNALMFDPDRFVEAKPDTYAWIPFGGGARRCIGAAFATMEMDTVLRTLLHDFHFTATDEPDEFGRPRDVVSAPDRGGLAVVRRRTQRAR
ncbi:cytochrome P450 [Streptomyces sp. NPDC008092]|uniref:cytochrome P450 n=1 Tax=Streptomyces sp. NPDC008092 TaxID=3364808 RepID=UPI0036E80A56